MTAFANYLRSETRSSERKSRQGKNKKAGADGNLLFFSNFESGNLHAVKTLNSGFEYEIWLRPDTLAEQYRNWFYFSVCNCQANQRVVLSNERCVPSHVIGEASIVTTYHPRILVRECTRNALPAR